MTTQKMVSVSGVVAGYDGPFTGSVDPNSDGSVTIDIRDVPAAIGGGLMPAFDRLFHYGNAIPAAASTSLVVHSSTLANGSLTISAQPDVARQLQAVVTPGTTGITAGELILEYVANDGTTTTDSLDLSEVGTTTTTLRSTKGALHVNSASVADLAGGGSPTVIVGTNATLGVPMNPFAVAGTIFKENLDGSDVAVGSRGTLTGTGLYTPATAPNGTHTFAMDYGCLSP